MSYTLRKIVEYETYYLLPLEGLKITKTLFYQADGENMIVIYFGDEHYQAACRLEGFELYDSIGNPISDMDVYMSNSPLENDVCINGKAYKNGTLEITLNKHKILNYPDSDYESWSFGDSNDIKIICLARGELMTFGVISTA